jgi:hypothetical protein
MRRVFSLFTFTAYVCMHTCTPCVLSIYIHRLCMYTCTSYPPCALSINIYRPSEQHHVGEGERRVGLPDRAAVERPEAQAHVEREAGVVCVGVVDVCD